MTPEEQARAMLAHPAMKRAIVEALTSKRRVSITDLAGRLTPEDCETIALVEHMAWHEGYSAGEADGIGRTNDDALSREEQVRAEERAAIVAWLRETADEIDARADQSSNEAQRSNLSGLAFGERFRAKQIENGRHHMTRDEYRERFFSSLRASGHEGGGNG